MKKTFKDLQEIDQLMSALYKENPLIEKLKFGYAYKRFIQINFIPVFKEFQTEMADVQIEHALTDEKTKEILMDPNNSRGFKYSKEEFKQLIKDEQAIINKFEPKEIEIKPFICSDIPEGLSEELKDKLIGLIIDAHTSTETS